MGDDDAGVGLAFDDGAGGGFGVAPNADVIALEELSFTPSGFAFGPLSFACLDGETAVLERLEFLPEVGAERQTNAAALGLAGVTGAAATDEDNRVGRRELLVLTGAVLSGSLLASSASADTKYPVAKFTLSRNDSVTHLELLDRVESALPPSLEFYVDRDGTRIDSIEDASADDETGTAALTDTGEFRIYTEDSIGNIARIQAWASGLLSGREKVSFEFELDAPAAEIAEREDSVVELTRHPAIAAPMANADGSDSILTIDGTSIPHTDERWGADRGEYWVEQRDDEYALVLEARGDAPDGANVELELFASRMATTNDAIGRIR